jgi:hypothetical protein
METPTDDRPAPIPSYLVPILWAAYDALVDTAPPSERSKARGRIIRALMDAGETA